MANKSQQKLTSETFWLGFRIISKYLKPHKRVVVFLLVFSLIAAVIDAFVPLLAGKIFDAIIYVGKNPLAPLVLVFNVIGLWFLLRMGSDITNWRIGFSNEKLGTVLESEYIANGFGKLLEMPVTFHKSKKHGEVIDRISRASGWLENLISRIFINLLPQFLSIGIVLVLTLFINYKLALILIAAVLIYVLILWQSVPGLATIQQKMHRAYNRAYGDAYDTLDNIQEVKQAATEKYEQKDIHRKFVGKAVPLWLSIAAIFRKLSFFQRLLITATQLSIFILSVYFVRNGTLTPGGLAAFNGYAAMIFGPFVLLGQNWQVIQNGIIALVRAERVLALPTEIYVPKNAVTPKKLAGNIVFENVSFFYKNSQEILKNVSFRAKAGEKIALVGKSGVGKTTIADLLLGFYFPQEGDVLVDGISIKKFNLTAYRSRIGVVPQEPTLFNDSVENNILYGNFGQPESKVRQAAVLAHAGEFIEKFPRKYKQLVGWRGIKLSTGQKQRIALARAFLRNPDILILDEPTSALDAKSEQLVKDSLRKLMVGRTTIIIAHRLSTIREADKILVLENGRVIEEGGHEKLIKIPNGTYRELYKLQTGIY